MPISSIDSRSAYFRSSETAKACLWLLSSRLSSRLWPSDGSRQSRCSSAAAAFSVASSRRPRISSEVEAQQPVVRPLAALDQQDAAERQHQQPPRRVVLAEEAAGDDVVPGLAQQRLRRRRLPVELQPVGLERQRVLAFRLGVVRAEREQRGRAGLAARGAEHRHLVPVDERMVGRIPLVAQRREEFPKPLALQGQPPFAAPLQVEIATEPYVVGGQGAQGGVRRPPRPRRPRRRASGPPSPGCRR